MNSTFTETSPALLQAIVDHSLMNTYAARAVRDTQTGELVDFQIYVSNPAFCRHVRHTQTDLQSHTLLTLFPILNETAFFAAYRQVVETGEPFEGEQEYPGLQGHFWYQTAVKKLEDGILVNFIDITEQKEASLTLQRQAQLLDGIFNGSLNGLFALKAIRNPAKEGGVEPIIDFQIIQANQMAARITRQPVETMVGERFSLFFPGYLPSGLFQQYVRTIETGQRQEIELYYPYDEAAAWYWVGSEPFGDGVILTFLDITQRKADQLVAEQQTALLQTTLDASISSIMAMTALRNEQGQIIDFRMDKANRAVERSLGKTPAQLEGRTLLSVYPGNVESGFFALYAEAADTGKLHQATQHYTDVNGFEGWFEVSAVRHGPDKIVLTFMNVTDYKQTEALVRQQADLLQSVLDATMNTVATYQAVRDPQSGRIIDFRFTMANQAALGVIELTADELYAKILLEVSPDLVNQAVFDQYVSVVQTGLPTTLERYRQGRWFLATAVRFGKDGLLTSSIDITANKQTQLQIERLNVQLQRSNDGLGQFAAIASHDLQEPLRKIIAFGDLLLDQYAPALGEGADLLRRMQAAAGRMQTLILDLLALSQLSKNDEQLHQPVALTKLVTPTPAGVSEPAHQRTQIQQARSVAPRNGTE
ncbi:PAS domain-containing sensor histidine kinase [Spirosoma fluviale]|uniref:histidine kinase n=1 Tax=Spirosoma fluviale TaxID=1597977 RepID=A0A286GAZ9_9BACT|nr:PAS domain-containing protein [Spirosoma fluviale]SOD92184.1 PAS fold-containing protein [Spirosoma fluviale]